jgi:hypothetical protein
MSVSTERITQHGTVRAVFICFSHNPFALSPQENIPKVREVRIMGLVACGSPGIGMKNG